ncbi:malonyl-[acyl-carrier protein] O-methyltransferase BioC [Endozoicomonas sp. OPT23]|uniref:malonyl-ACP O-methyltransferase BioC n=1 Tax=Endozoicomonas sp. OPT23 TaxID=2072845 RepID=UPI00129BC4FC|nr:malonyl-ACP O-methyltransferase BioC [Endozoicomonas sp. OPT23]MRI31716.1 malonyl-[acyl-carrier protein] O-methyltransferase BioC [Endozoicomonas sp. OPT23]
MQSKLRDREALFKTVDKQRVAANFSRAAETYDSAAALQKRVAARAMLGVPAGFQPERVLDLGSGTGSQTSILKTTFSDAHVTGVDLAMGMLKHASSQELDASWCRGDIESLPFKNDSFDLVFSSLAIQWCELETVLSEVRRILKPGGLFVFSSLAKGTMVELNQAWQQVDSHVHINGFDPFSLQQQKVSNSALQQRSLMLQQETLYYPSVLTLLRELKALGVNTVHSAQQGLTTRARIQKLEQAYESSRTEVGLPLSYQVIYGTLVN